jgi:hypothetical protein
MNDTIKHRSSFDEVTDALFNLFIQHRNNAFKSGLDFIEFLNDKERYNALCLAQEELCVRMGWTHKLHRQMDHERTLKAMQEDQ